MKDIQWRDSMRSPKLYVVDVRLFVLMLAWAFWPRVWTLVPVLVVIGFLVVVGHKGYRPAAALRALRRWVGGSPRGLSPRRYRRIVDYGAVGGLAVLAMVGGESDVHAEFRYVPPAPAQEQPAPAVVRPVPEDGGVVITPGSGEPVRTRADLAAPWASLAREEPVSQHQWRVVGGSTLAATLTAWGRRANVEVVMLTDREYRIESSHTYTGEFLDAVRALLFGLGHLSYAPVGEVLDDGRMLVVRHVAPIRREVQN